MRFSTLVAVAVLATGSIGQIRTVQAAEPVKRTAISLQGAPKFAADFKAFDWVNADAPKGGTIRLAASGSFDTLNAHSDQGVPAAALSFLEDTLFADSLDEPNTSYGLIAEWLSYPDDYSSVTFGLRPQARFNDGAPITPDDVIFSLEALKSASASRALYWKNVVSAEKTGEREVTFKFDKPGNRELPQIVGQLVVVSKAYWTGTDASGKPRDITKSTLDIPLGSGAYRIKSVDAGRSITYERVKDYWAKDLPVSAGQNNFDEIKFIYYRDRTASFEAFKTGQLDFWVEDSASRWATQYDFPALKKGWVKKETLPIKRVAHMQAFALNVRRPKFADINTRRALNLIYNFEEANAKLFHDSYTRTASFYERSELKPVGLPQGRELELLDKVKNEIPPEVFTAEYKNPNNSPQNRRANLTEASKLLAKAGWTKKDTVLVGADGAPFTIEFLTESDAMQRVILPYIEDLRLLGITGSIRLVDDSQYQRRVDSRDFDVIVQSYQLSTSPGNEQRDYWGSAAADKDASANVIGIKSKAVDALIEDIVYAKNREDLVAATRALDRVLMWSAYVVPQWHAANDRFAIWDMFAIPAKPPGETSLTLGLLRTWWVDPAKLPR